MEDYLETCIRREIIKEKKRMKGERGTGWRGIKLRGTGRRTVEETTKDYRKRGEAMRKREIEKETRKRREKKKKMGDGSEEMGVREKSHRGKERRRWKRRDETVSDKTRREYI